jgi:prepilin-type N-terminal cleavage/methylation domain-containing protein
MQPQRTNILTPDFWLLTPGFSILTPDSWLLTSGFLLLTPARRKLRSKHGFTLIETLLAVVILGLMTTSIGALYVSGLDSLDAGHERMLLDSHLRSRMELLMSQSFDLVTGGSEVVTVKGQNYTINWTAPLVDLDGDSLPDADAKHVTVSVAGEPGLQLSVILVDNEGRVGKIP